MVIVSILPIDTGRYGTKEMLEIFREQKKIDYQLEIEAAAVLSQNEIGLIPASIARDIARASKSGKITAKTVSYTHLRAHETCADLVCRLLLEKKNRMNMK